MATQTLGDILRGAMDRKPVAEPVSANYGRTRITFDPHSKNFYVESDGKSFAVPAEGMRQTLWYTKDNSWNIGLRRVAQIKLVRAWTPGLGIVAAKELCDFMRMVESLLGNESPQNNP